MCEKAHQMQLNDEEGKYEEVSTDILNSNSNDTVLYVCATIWHENNNEMLQLLKSLMKYFIYRHLSFIMN